MVQQISGPRDTLSNIWVRHRLQCFVQQYVALPTMAQRRTKVDLQIPQALRCIIGAHSRREREGNRRVARGEPGIGRSQDSMGKQQHRLHIKGLGLTAAEQAFGRPFQHQKGLLHTGQIGPPHLGQGHSMSVAHEQRRAHTVLQRADLLTDSGGRHGKFRGRTSKPFAARGSLEHAQPVQRGKGATHAIRLSLAFPKSPEIHVHRRSLPAYGLLRPQQAEP